MEREDGNGWNEMLCAMNQAILIGRGMNRAERGCWFLFGLPGNAYFTVEVPLHRSAPPQVVPCSQQGAMALFDDATRRFAPTLDVARATDALRGRLLDEPPTDN